MKNASYNSKEFIKANVSITTDGNSISLNFDSIMPNSKVSKAKRKAVIKEAMGMVECMYSDFELLEVTEHEACWVRN